MTPAQIAQHLLENEHLLMTSPARRSSETLKRLLWEDFLEFGASGATYDLAALIALLAVEPDGPAATISDFTARLLSPDVALVTYRTQLGFTARLRSSIWRREDGAWRMQFHQGTPTT